VADVYWRGVMKNQYFGDVNDYRKYGLLRLLSGEGGIRMGVCWMLTPDDEGPDGKKTHYLDDSKRTKWRAFDPQLYDVLRTKVKGHETEPQSRDVKHFDESLLPNSVAWGQVLNDSASDRESYFDGMWSKFSAEGVQLVFFDPDDGLANIGTAKTPMKKGHKNSAKKIFKDEVETTFRNGFSALLYQHFVRKERKQFTGDLARNLKALLGAPAAFSFSTPHVLFLLLPHPDHHRLLCQRSQAVEDSAWSAARGCKSSKATDGRQILVQRHTMP
jgi:hypothetical protein